jgi:uroporphyrinogen-III synthase
MRLLLTRPREDAERSARTLRARGHEVELEPLLAIRFRPDALDPARDLAGVQALALTSLNGLRAYLAAGGPKNLPVFAVGPASAAAAQEAGFASVRAAGGDIRSLAALIVASLDPAAGALLHPAGTVSAGDLAGALATAGFTLRRAVLYEAAAAGRLSERTVTLLRAHAFDGALFYSPRTAATFVSLVRRAALESCCASLTAYCLSPAVAGALGSLEWVRLRVATEPSEAALLQAVEADRNR